MKFFVIAFSSILIILDQIFKHLAIEHLKPLVDRSYPIIQDIFHLTYLENTGAAFGMLEGNQILLICVTAFILIAFLYLLFANKLKSKLLMVAAGVIFAGGVGNFIDRIMRGYVVDYLDFRLINFWVFNFADMCVVIGICLMLVAVILLDKNESKVKVE